MRRFVLTAVFALSPWHALAETDLTTQSWDQIVTSARGGTVNFFMWGGADNINRYVSEYLSKALKDQYDITLNRVGVNDTAEAVNIVLGEQQAGVTDQGTVDLIWINGANFRTMKQGGLVFCGGVDKMPNAALINWDNPAIANDFGTPVEGCEVPWSRAQFALAYDSAKMTAPQDMPALLAWIKANPGQFTYPAPPDFNGSVFVRHVFYYAAGGADNLMGPFDPAKYEQVAAKTWAILNDLEPYLWRQGQTYPNTITQLNELFSNAEVAMTFDYDASQFGLAVQAGKYPETTRSYGLRDGTIGNTNYTAIPFNSPNKAAALVLQNLMISAAAQLDKARPEVWGAAPAIEMDRTDVQAEFAALPSLPAVVSSAELAKHALPELQAEWSAAIDQGWIENVGR